MEVARRSFCFSTSAGGRRSPSSVFTAINSVAEDFGAPSNAVGYNLFKLARGLFMKKLRRSGESTRSTAADSLDNIALSLSYEINIGLLCDAVSRCFVPSRVITRKST